MRMVPYSAVSVSQSRLPASATKRPRRLAGPSRCSAKPLCFPVAVGHGANQSVDCFASQLVRCMVFDQAAGRWLLVQHSGPCGRAVCLRQTAKRKAWLSAVGPVVLFDRQDPLDRVLAQGHIVQAAFLLQWQKGEALHHRAGEHAGAVPLGHTVRRRPFVGIVHTDAEQA